MSVLLKILSAMRVADLPPVCRSYWDDDTEFAENFGCLDDDSKCDYIRDTFKRCLEYNIRDDHNILRMCMLVIKGEEEDYEDEDTPHEQHVDIPVYSPPPPHEDTTKLKQELAEAKEQIRKLQQAQVVVEPEPERTSQPKPDTEVKRGRGRPPKHPNLETNKCVLCNIGFASSGSLYNHYHSKPHNDAVLAVLQQARPIVETEDKHYKIIVKVRSHCDDPGFTMERPCVADIDNIKDYVADKHNPITDVLLVEKPAGAFSWKKVC